jgi:hypothetical protein
VPIRAKVAFFNLDGSYDPQQDLICEGPEAVRWGRELFEHYLRRARHVEIFYAIFTGPLPALFGQFFKRFLY